MTKIRHLTVRACIAAAIALPLCAQADDYRAELGVGFEHTSFDGEGVPNAREYGVAGTYYLEPVTTDGLPLAEAAFLNRSSFVRAGTARAEFGDGKIDIFHATAGYYMPDTIFYGELSFTYLDDFSPGDRSIFSGAFGVTPIDGLLVLTRFDEDGWDPNVTAKYVGKLPNAHFYAATVSAVDPDEGDVDVRLDVDYFLDTTLSVGAGVGRHDWTLRAEKFFTPGFAVGGRFSALDEGDQFGASVTWRF
jgi:hypothetical protein